ncbi:HTH domain-containing protein [Blautia producta]|uniref:HTH domain-containing protein n=1 Tax=Blautia producta TaxID=33035 RepID=UPI002F410611
MKVDRLVSIIMILLDKKRIGAQELADMFEVSPRTIPYVKPANAGGNFYSAGLPKTNFRLC